MREKVVQVAAAGIDSPPESRDSTEAPPGQFYEVTMLWCPEQSCRHSIILSLESLPSVRDLLAPWAPQEVGRTAPQLCPKR